MRRFEQRTVVITGASRGIGKGIAKRFADEGANLVLAANEASVEAVAEEFRSAGANAVSSVCDVTNKAEVEALYDLALTKFGQVDVSIQNAGVRNIPMKRAGKAEDVAGLVAFLASDDAAYITGQTINVDGGLIMS